MKSTELRIGNFILNDGVINQIYEIKEQTVTLLTNQGNKINARTELIKPIPISEEELLKFGFLYNKESALYSKGGYDVQFIGEYIEFYFSEYGSWYLSLNYIHELQNLFNSLTGTELTLKP